MTTTDQRLCEAVAKVWVDGGGDADGVIWCTGAIVAAVRAEIYARVAAENEHMNGEDA